MTPRNWHRFLRHPQNKAAKIRQEVVLQGVSGALVEMDYIQSRQFTYRTSMLILPRSTQMSSVSETKYEEGNRGLMIT